MEFRQLEAFVAVINHKSFSKAAETLHLTQPAVSNQTIALEKELGIKLLIRSNKEVLPTKEGCVFYRYACDILTRRQQAAQVFSDIQNATNSVVSVGAPLVPTRHCLPPLVGEFRRRHSNISFKIYTMDSKDIVQDVSDGRIEIGIASIFVSSPACLIEELLHDRWVLITPNTAHYRQRLECGSLIDCITQERFINRQPGSGTRKDLDHFLSQLGVESGALKITAELDDTEAIIKMVSEGVGVSIVSRLAAESYHKTNRILWFEFHQPASLRPIYILRNKNITLTNAAQKFYNFSRRFYQSEG